MDVLRLHFEEDILRLLRDALMTCYFSLVGQVYQQGDGVAIGWPLRSSPTSS
jgi:hypothetical protein